MRDAQRTFIYFSHRVSPFNRIELFNVTIPDQRGDTLLYAKKLGVGISIDDLITHNRICLNNIQLFGMDVNITRDSLTRL